MSKRQLVSLNKARILAAISCEITMARFLFYSFALVLLYPSGIDMYLIGLPRIAADLSASEAQLHIAFSVYLAGMATAMLIAGRIADKAGRYLWSDNLRTGLRAVRQCGQQHACW